MESNPVYHLLIKCKKEEMKSREGDQNKVYLSMHPLGVQFSLKSNQKHLEELMTY